MADLGEEYMDKYGENDARRRRLEDDEDDEEDDEEEEIPERPVRTQGTNMDSTFVYQYLKKEFNQLLEKKNLLKI